MTVGWLFSDCIINLKHFCRKKSGRTLVFFEDEDTIKKKCVLEKIRVNRFLFGYDLLIWLC